MTDRCPRCGAKRQEGSECPHCGVIYANAERRARETAAATVVIQTTRVRACPSCQGQVSTTAPACPHCGEVFQQQPTAWPVRSLLGYGGAAVLALGVFAPIVRLPIVGTMNYFHNGEGDGVILLVLAAVSVLAVALRRWFVLYGTGGGSLMLLAYALFAWSGKMRTARAEYSASMAGNPFSGIGEAMFSTVQLQLGWVLLFIGACLLLAAAILSRDEP